MFPVVCIVAIVAVVGAGTTRVVLLRDGTVLVPGVPGTVDVVLVPCVPVTGTVTGGEAVLGVTALVLTVPGTVPCMIFCVACTCVCCVTLAP